MFKDINFRIGAISAIFTLAVLVVIPQIPIVVDNRFLKVDSYLGGYVIKAAKDAVVWDLSDFRKDLEFGGGVRLIYEFDTAQVNEENLLGLKKAIKEVYEKRLKKAGYEDFRIGFSEEKSGVAVIELPHYERTKDIIFLTEGSGRLVLRQLKEPEIWDPDEFTKFFTDISLWEDTGITEKDIEEISIISSNAEQTQVKFIFTKEGKTKFLDAVLQNIDKPIGMYADDSNFPLALPVVSSVILQNPEIDPMITGSFDKREIEALAVKIKVPNLPVETTYLGSLDVGPAFGADFSKALVVSFGLVVVYMFFRYGRFGLLLDVVLLFGFLLFLAFLKLFLVVLNIHSLSGIVFSFSLFVYGCLVLAEDIKRNVLARKPLDISVFEAYKSSYKYVKTLGIGLFILFTITYLAGSPGVKWFSAAISLGALVFLINYFLITQTLFEVFSFAKEKKK